MMTETQEQMYLADALKDVTYHNKGLFRSGWAELKERDPEYYEFDLIFKFFVSRYDKMKRDLIWASNQDDIDRYYKLAHFTHTVWSDFFNLDEFPFASLEGDNERESRTKNRDFYIEYTDAIMRTIAKYICESYLNGARGIFCK